MKKATQPNLTCKPSSWFLPFLFGVLLSLPIERTLEAAVEGGALVKGDALSDGTTVIPEASATSKAIKWTTADLDPSIFDHNSSTPSRLKVKAAGDYFLAFTGPILQQAKTADRRSQVHFFVKKNGSTTIQAGTARSTYIRHDSDHTESSGHMHLLLPSLSANDYVEIYAKCFDNASENSVKLGTASLFLEKFASPRPFFSPNLATAAAIRPSSKACPFASTMWVGGGVGTRSRSTTPCKAKQAQRSHAWVGRAEAKGRETLLRKWTGRHADDCSVCKNGGQLLCCDFCSTAIHMECLLPALKTCPEGDWFCPECSYREELLHVSRCSPEEWKRLDSLKDNHIVQLCKMRSLPRKGNREANLASLKACWRLGKVNRLKVYLGKNASEREWAYEYFDQQKGEMVRKAEDEVPTDIKVWADELHDRKQGEREDRWYNRANASGSEEDAEGEGNAPKDEDAGAVDKYALSEHNARAEDYKGFADLPELILTSPSPEAKTKVAEAAGKARVKAAVGEGVGTRIGLGAKPMLTPRTTPGRSKRKTETGTGGNSNSSAAKRRCT